jgi:UDP-N-acetyl-D-glucosamine dehydrogenase
MTPQDLVEAPATDRFEGAAFVRRGEHPRETDTGAVRATRSADVDRALVAIVGLGRVGLPSAIALRRAGLRIVGIDSSARRLSDIRDGRAELPRADREELREQLGADFALTDDAQAVHGADAVLICVPTSVDRHGVASADALRRTCASVVEHARAGQTLVLTSTTYVGSTRELLVEPLSARGLCVGEDVFVAFSPERIDAGAGEH